MLPGAFIDIAYFEEENLRAMNEGGLPVGLFTHATGDYQGFA